MPQMMPMYWLCLFCLCFLLIMLTINFIYFSPPEMLINHNKSTQINKSNLKKTNWNWMWN